MNATHVLHDAQTHLLVKQQSSGMPQKELLVLHFPKELTLKIVKGQTLLGQGMALIGIRH